MKSQSVPAADLAARRGAVLIAALVALTVVMAMLGSMLQGTLRVRRQMHAERDLRQCQLLLRAGTQRVEFRRGQDAGYPGETWDLPAAAILGHGDGKVTIEPAGEADSGAFRVTAEYPLGGETSIRRSCVVHFDTKTSPAQE